MRVKWKDIPGYEGKYQSSNTGLVRGLDRFNSRGYFQIGKILKPCQDSTGYLTINLHNGVQKNFKVHTIIALTFFGIKPKNMEVCHGELGPLDNSVSNLRYDTSKMNGMDMRKTKTNNGKRVLRSDGIEFDSMTIAGEETGCDFRSISAVCLKYRNRKTAGGFGWKFI